jgi:hypothetical protein|tara:strand:+ start:738 stop:1085 length:348 start_codon:yes stop_codon:yes gene_type:complete
MKKLTLTIGLVATMLTAKSQDTTCTMITKHEVIKFNYYTDDILRHRNHTRGSVFIDLTHNQVECLHLFDEFRRYRTIVLTFDDGTQVSQVVESESNVYFINGPARIEVKRPRLIR